MEGVKVRRVPRARVLNTNSSDFLALVKLHKQLFGADYSPDWKSAAWWVAEAGGKVIGFIGVEANYPVRGTAYVCRVGVKPSYGGKGLAKRLIRVATRCAATEGYKTVTCYTRDNPASANAFIACGYRVVRPAEAWATKDALYLLKKL